MPRIALVDFVLAACISGAVFFPSRSFAAPTDAIDVTVQGPPLLARATDDAAASSTVSSDSLASPGATIGDALAEVPSLRVTRTGGASDVTTVGLRGASSAETPVYLGGIRWNDQVTGVADLSTLPLFFLKRIDVYRGSGPVELGEMGLGGALVLVPELPTRSELHAGTGFGSFGELSAFAAASVATASAGAGVAARIDQATNDFTYSDDHGIRFDPSASVERQRQNADATTADVFVVGRTELGARATTTSVLHALHREQGIVGLGVAPAEHARATFDDESVGIDSTVRCADDPKDDRCTLKASVFGRRTSYNALDPFFELPFGTADLTARGEEAGVRLSAGGSPWTPLRVLVGAEQIFDLLGLDLAGDKGLRARRDASRAFGTIKLAPLEALAFDVALSFGSTRTDGPTPSPTDVSPEVRGGVRVRPIPELDFYANASRYVRVPTLGETYGISDTVRGNDKLVPERGPGVEGGARFSRRFGTAVDLALEGVVFARWATDLIAYARSSFGELRPYNVGAARVVGAEITAASVLAHVVRVDGALTITDARDTSAPSPARFDRLPYLATYSGAAGAHLDLDAPFGGSALSHFSVGTNLVARSERPVDGAGLVFLPAQFLWDADIALTLARGTLIVRGRVSNLANDRTTDTVGYPVPGRAGHVTFEAVLR